MKILVTGSEGYIGSVLVPFLQRKKHEVVGLDACYLYTKRFLPEKTDYELIREDIRDIEISELKGFDAICHLAALSNDPTGELIPEITEDINYWGTVSLAKKAKKAGIKRFIFSGSCSVYGASDTKSYLNEESPFNPVTSYAKSKVLSERDLRKIADETFSPVYLRNATAFGVSPKLRLDVVVNNLVALAFVNNKIAMTSDGTPWRPLAHVKDICMAFQCALEAPISTVHNQAFNIGQDENNYQIKDIADTIQYTATDSEVTFAKESKNNKDKRTYKVSFEKARDCLPNFAPKFSLLEGIKELFKSYRRFGLKKEHLECDDFIRLHRYKKLMERNEIGRDFRWVKKAAA